MYSLILEGEGGPTEDRENSLIFFLFFIEPFPYFDGVNRSVNDNVNVSGAGDTWAQDEDLLVFC